MKNKAEGRYRLVYNRKKNKMCDWFKNQVKAQDYFAEKVTLTQGGNTEYRSLLGGCASILTCFGVVAYGYQHVLDLYFHPKYSQYPVTYDYDYGQTILWDLQKNMPSYQIRSPSIDNPLETLRVLFFDMNTHELVPSVYCEDYYAEKIAAELSGQSNSTFYS